MTPRSILLFGTIVLASFAFADQQREAVHAAPTPVSADQQSQATRQLRHLEYEFSAQGSGEFTAPNRSHDLRSSITPVGLDVTSRTRGEAGLHLTLTLSGYGRDGAIEPVGQGTAMSTAARVDLDRGSIKEWFVNNETGLEHGFILNAPPAAQHGPVHLRIAVGGTLTPSPGERESELILKDAAGNPALLYKNLLVRDAGGAAVPSRFVLRPGEIVIEIQDRGAAYPLTVDPLLTIPSWIAESNQAGALMGYSVATAGDVNHDGYADVIVGAATYDHGDADEGGAFLYLGSASGLATTPAWTAEGNQLEDQFGASVATAGDVNGDGYDDVIVGAPHYHNGQTDEGRAYVYLGSAAGLAANPAWVVESNQASSLFGLSVSTAGDVNHDGYSDVIVGAYGYDSGETDEGAAFVYMGSAAGLSTSPAWIGQSNQAGANLGNSVSTAGDVNHDGYSDVIVGAHAYDNGQTDEGRAFVYLGSATGLSASPAWTAESDQANAFFGFSVGAAGDVNGDGYSDVIVGAYGYDNGQTDEGRAYVYLGSAAGLSASPAWTAESDQPNAQFGRSVATAKDVNGDGYADVIVGAYGYDNGQTDEGRAYVYLGSATGLSASPAWTAESDQANAFFGFSVGAAGDVNGDGLSEVIVGAHGYSNGQANEGRAYVFMASAGEDIDCDGVGSVLDCDGANDQVWATPAEALNLRFPDKTTITWNPPAALGGTAAATLYDTLRSDLASDFASGSVLCLDPDGLTAVSTDAAVPTPGHVFYYLARAKNSCADGSLGTRSNGNVRAGRSCGGAVVCNDGNACTTDHLVDGVCVHDTVPPVIVEAPESVAACVNDTVLFNVRATGQGTLHYQWKRNGVNAGTDSPRFSLSIPDPGNQVIACVVSDNCSSATTPNATLTRFATAASCSGGLAGPEATNGASEPPMGGDPTRAPTGVNTGGVYLHSGEYHLTETDMTIKGRGFDFEWNRSYRSRLGRLTTMGQNWDFSYNISIATNGANRTLFNGYNRSDTYVPSTASCFTAAGFFRELCLQGNGTYVLTFPQKTTWTFAPLDGSPAQGKITQIRDRNGNTMSFAYDGSGRLTAITDTLGRTITVGYNPDGYVSALTDFAGRTVSYTYYANGDLDGKAGDLRTATSPAVTGTPTGNDFPLGRTTTYTYTTTPGFADDHNLRKIIDPLGNVIVNNIYTVETIGSRRDQVDRQVFPDGVTAYVYIAQTPGSGNNFAVTKTIVNDRAGNVREVFFGNQNGQIQTGMLREYTGRAPDHEQPTNDTFNRPTAKLRATDPAFFETRYAWNADSLLTSVTLPEGDTIAHTYDSANADIKLRANETQTVRTAGPRGGDQATLTTHHGYTTTFGREPCACKGCCGEGGGKGFWTSLQTPRGFTHTRTVDPVTGDITAMTAPLVTTGVLGGGSQTLQDTWTYNAFGQALSHVDSGGRCSRASYYTSGPATGYLEKAALDLNCDGTIGGADLVTVFQYDARGNPTSVTDARGNPEAFTYNQLDELVRKTSKPPFSFQSDYTYDARGRLVRSDVPNIDDQGLYLPNHHLVTTRGYNALGQVVSEMIEGTPDCEIREWQYEPNGHVTLEKSAEAVNGNQPTSVIRHTYDERDLPYRVTGAEGNPSIVSTTQWDYDKNGNVVTKSEGIEGTPHVTTYAHDGYERRTSKTDPDGTVLTNHYDADGNAVSVRIDGELIDGESGSNVRLYEATASLDEVDRPIQENIAHFNPQTGSPIGDGTSSTITYYNAASQVIRVTDDGGHSTDTSYDAAGRPLTVTDALTNTTTYDYDANSNITTITNVDKSGLGNPSQTLVRSYVIDSLDRVSTVTDSGGNLALFGYDSRGNIVREIDPKGNVTHYSYDAAGRLVRTERDLTNTGDGSGSVVRTIVTTQAWDANSRLKSQTDDNGNTTAYEYDALGRLTKTTYADGKIETRVYDVHGAITTATDPIGNVLTATHDLKNRLKTLAIARAAGVLGTTSETWKWDGRSRVVSAGNDGTLVTRAYDSLSNLTTETQKIGAGPTRTLVGVFDGDGNRTSATYPSGRSVTATYDADDRMSTIVAGARSFCSLDPDRQCVVNVDCQVPPPNAGTCVFSPATNVATYTYLGPYRVERRTYNNGTRMDLTYDLARRIVDQRHMKISPLTTLSDWTFAWDPSSYKTSRSDLRPGGATGLYQYDSAGRLTQATDLDGTTAFSLDDVGNRTSIVFNGGPPQLYSMNPALPEPADFQMNQYTSAPASDTPRLHDASGNLTQYGDRASYSLGPDGCPGLCGVNDDGDASVDNACEVCPRNAAGVDVPYGDDTCAGGHPNPSQAGFDYQNQMVEFRLQQGCGTPETYVYDPFGRRLQAGSTQYFYDGWRTVEERNGAGAVTAAYIYGRDTDEVLRQERGGSIVFDHGDDLGNVTALTDSSGNVTERYDYGAFGAPKFFTAGGSPIPASAIGNTVLFNGQHWDASSKLYYYRTRYMDPRTGRFTTRDSIGIWGDESNLGNGYSYVANNPWGATDPMGTGANWPWGEPIRLLPPDETKMQPVEEEDPPLAPWLFPGPDG